MMNYPIIYDALDDDFSGYGLAILENAKDVLIREKLNGHYLLSFALPRDDAKWMHIQEENYVKVDGQLFAIRRINDGRENSGQKTASIQAEHVVYELNEEYIEDRRAIDASAQHALSIALEGTRFAVGHVDDSDIATAYFVKLNAMQAVNRILERWGGEFKFDNFAMHWYAERGNDLGVQFRYRKNLRSVNRIIGSQKVVTRLYPYGHDGQTIGEINGGLNYIESEHIGDYPRPKSGTVTFAHIEDPTELLNAAQEHLSQVDTPTVSYDVDVIELKKLAEYGNLEAFELGDWIAIIDEDLGYNVRARVVEYDRYPYEPRRSRVVLANFVQGVQDFLSKLQETRRTVDAAFRDGYLSTSWLEGALDTLRNQLVASTANVTIADEDGIMIVSGDGESALNLKGGIFAVADSKDAGGNWEWRTFGTGSGFTADEMKSGKILTSLIQIVGEATQFYWDSGGLYAKDPEDPNQYIIFNALGLRGYTGDVKRLHVGPYAPGKFGLELKDETGGVTILDEDGMLQTWQEGRADNIASGYPLVLNIYLPAETKSIHKGLLRFRRLAFRAYSASAASGGGHTVSISADTTGASSTTTTGPSSSDTTSVSNHSHTYGQKTVGLTHGFNTRTTSTESGHSHTVSDKSADSAYLDVDTTWGGGGHSHGMGHTHNLSHTHGMSHNHTISAHAHDIIYGIHTGATPGGVTVKVNNTTIGTYSSDQAGLNIKDYLVAGQWNTVELSATSLGRIDATVFIQAKMGV
ncbi:MAG: phage tail spike protein [Candidatus Desulforudaceae bacterium]